MVYNKNRNTDFFLSRQQRPYFYVFMDWQLIHKLSKQGVQVGSMMQETFSNKENSLQIQESVNGKDVYIVQTGRGGPQVLVKYLGEAGFKTFHWDSRFFSGMFFIRAQYRMSSYKEYCLKSLISN